MANVKKKIIYSVYFFLMIFYLCYLLIDQNYMKKTLAYNIIFEVENINNFINKNRKIDAIILGGSNAVQGLSAKQFSDISTKNFYNLSMDYEGGNKSIYFNSIIEKTTNIDRDKVRLILYSTLRYFDQDSIKFKKYNIKKIQYINLLPSNSLMVSIKKRGLSLFNNHVYKTEVFKSTEHGDRRDVSNSFNSNLNSFDFNNNLPIELVTEDIISIKKIYSQLFPNALFILVTPPVYNTKPEFQNSFILELSKSFKKNNINFIHQPPIVFFKPIWTNNSHLNSNGRKIRTDNLYKILNSNYNLKEIFY